METQHSKVWLIIVIIVVALVLIGGGVYYFTHRAKVFKSDDGSTKVTMGQNVTKPKDFPTNMPLYPGVTYSSFTTGPEGSSYVATTKDTPGTVLAWFRNQLPAKGWKIDIDTNNLLQISTQDLGGTVNMADTGDGTYTLSFSSVPKSILNDALGADYDQTTQQQKELLNQLNN